MVLAGEFDHEHPSDGGDRPADTDVGATVHLPHDPFEDPGGELSASLVTEEQAAGGGVGGEGERVRRRVAQVGDRVVSAECFGGVDQGVVGGDRGVQVAGGLRVGEKLMQTGLQLVGEVGVKAVEVSGHPACLAFQVEQAALGRGVGPEDLDGEVGDWFTLASLETPYLGFLPRRWCGLVQRRPARSRGLRSPREGLRESPVSGFLHHVNDDTVTASR